MTKDQYTTAMVFQAEINVMGDFAQILTDGRTYGWTDGQRWEETSKNTTVRTES